MEPFTHYFQKPHNSKWFWALQPLVIGVNLLPFLDNNWHIFHPDGTWHISRFIQVIALIALITLDIILVIFVRTPERRPRLVISDKGFTHLPHYFRKIRQVEWHQISSIQLKSNTVEVVTNKFSKPIKIFTVDYNLTQKIKQLFQTAAKEHDIAIQP